MRQFITQKLAQQTPRILTAKSQISAAVLVAITDDHDNPEVILTRRAKHMPTHKGQIAFPGGKAEDDDKSLIATALREASEEVALRPESVVVVGQMGQVLSRQGFVVTPVVGVVPAGIVSELIPNLGELDRIFTVPLKFLIDGPRVMDALPLAKGVNQVPSFYYDDYRIWGMTAFILAEFVNLVYDARIDLYSKPKDD
ncbi:CoA pyrophosphatase [Oceanospirillaceae bacterium]|jgi:8-oxo-dGTP pyrophosphatase MutT (NUDIX family)|uniref:CoA pyrophosphatase n=1 Tax=Candidatus Njordibacter sp. Uisw_002 TaxID=3230971 RepID=UPI00233D5DA1|nr:CoA pyrophosphatase [Oceanospirillaceae bacterium]MDB9753732.1 CoA pyrophosphatase [Oceanospirillaceae bacterium]MDB9869171.1 CoA pyrophosphatase [Oceanospirillaceae bacterium]MDC1341421.1 CoA pyrophosphatase [Oceanospirillaceae bacterium]MDC1509211.1 CoA pyrophosphatase [Oceanospirillaceae bacterium]|tara:strand:+ start:1329 stop:1922 length:594 start_codon:yes stop_codon:yes gene_type:complete